MRECPICLSCYGDDVAHCPVEGHATINSLPGEPALDGRYLLERRLGQGGMGVVYKAHHVFLKSPHAIKVIMPDLVGNDPSVATRFRQEAMAAAAIRHPNIISVTDYGFIRGEIPFLVMEFVEGDSLQDVMTQQQQFPPEKALEYVKAIAAGVGAAHRQNIIHRDLKPLNIMILNDRMLSDGLKILDFGLAKIKSGELLGSFVGAKTTGIIGSPYYMAPEQWSDEEPDKRCDIYSLGIILHQMLTGDVPFKGSSIPAVMKKHLMTPPPPLASVSAGISDALERVVHHALEKDPKDRTATAEDLIAELEQAISRVNAISGKRVTRRRSTSKSKVATSRAKNSVSTLDPPAPKKPRRGNARITAEQKTAQPADEGIARGTAEQLGASLSDEEVINSAANLAGHSDSSASEKIVVDDQSAAGLSNVQIAESNDNSTPQGANFDTVVETYHVLTDPPQGSGVQRGNERDNEDAGDLGSDEQESWRRAAQDARRRAEERALRESQGGSVESRLSTRAPSISSQSNPPAQSLTPSPVSPTRGKFAGLLQNPLLAAGLVAIAFGAIAVAYLLLSAKPAPNTDQSSTTPSPVGRDMVFIKAGSFMMGSNGEGVAQSPAHIATVISFYIDKTEVTNSEYANFIKKTGHPPPSNDDSAPEKSGYWSPWSGTDPPPGRGRWPVGNVTVADAEAFAQWLSKRDGVKYRLPTEEEWEYVARNGPMATLFPWGNSWIEGRANLNGFSSPREVGSFQEGATLQGGVLDMMGNVWEWTASKGGYYKPEMEIEEKRAASQKANVVRGGSFLTTFTGDFSNAASRTWIRGEPKYKSATIGFRLVRDAN